MGNWLRQPVGLSHHIGSKVHKIVGNATSDAQLLILLPMETS